MDGLTEEDGEREELGEREADGLSEAEGERLREAEAEGEIEADGLSEDEGEPDALAEGEYEAEGDCEKLAAAVRPGASPYQSTPGRGPGIPSSYRKILVASARASFGRRDLSIRVITPRFQLFSVK